MKIYIREYDTILETDSITSITPYYCDKTGSSICITLNRPAEDRRGDGIWCNVITVMMPSAEKARDAVEQIALAMEARAI